MEATKQNCSISINSSLLSADNVLLKFSLRNPHNKKMKLLMWYTPFEGFLSDLFIITNSDSHEKLKYQGPMVKRLKPQPEDYLSISANEVSSTTLNLSLSYHFPPGNYQLKLKSHIYDYEDEHLNHFPFICETSSIKLSIK
jgi:hypothetical protein